MLALTSVLAAFFCQAAGLDPHAHHRRAALPAVAAPPASGVAALESDRIASGTAWQPAGPPHAGWHFDRGRWRLMLHGLLFAGYDWQGGPRGADAPVALGWLMGALERRGEASSLILRAMLSPEPWTVGAGGYPLLLQTGETYQGQPLHDRQHPHDLLMELAVLHTQELTPALAVQGYAALAGEPALGPVGFPHRMSALADPMAPLGHHWLDSTHVTFGVLTLGVVTRYVKLEGSWFNGREPDERRWDVDLHRPDSFSARLAVAPLEGLVGQVSYGHIPSPHGSAGHPDGLDRTTASLTHQATLGTAARVATTLAWGLNHGHGDQNALLAESTVDLDGANLLFTRAELVQKSGHDLVLPPPLDEEEFALLSVVMGYLRNLPPVASVIPGVGVRLAGNYVPSALGPIYGSRRFPLGAMVYVRLLPPLPHH
jgi:hypothetical protein